MNTFMVKQIAVKASFVSRKDNTKQCDGTEILRRNKSIAYYFWLP